jgi:hypothetical protein
MPVFVPPGGSVPNPEGLIETVMTDLGDISELTTDEEVLGWLNQGVGRLPARYESSFPFTYVVGDQTITLPGDFIRFDRLELRNGYFGAYEVRGKQLVTFDALKNAGDGVVYYLTNFPQLPPDGDGSALPLLAREAVVAYAQYKFFQKLASSRADFRRYVTITGQNGLDVSDMADLAERHRQDFVDALTEFEEQEDGQAVTFYGE